MKTLKKLFCRSVQMMFRIALPILPYKDPTILERTDEIIGVLKEKEIDPVPVLMDAKALEKFYYMVMETEEAKDGCDDEALPKAA